MDKLEHVARRTNLALLWGGLACLLFSVAAALAIWMHPSAGPDLRTEFCMVLVPGGALGVVFSLWGLCELRAGKKRAW
jgi:4-amino-4-deoxy-L-arabinose transferase-like glycosyltransferase